MKVTHESNGATTYQTTQGDMLDAIAFRHYGTHEKTTELLLLANPGVEDLPVVLPLGTRIILPVPPVRNNVQEVIRLWD